MYSLEEINKALADQALRHEQELEYFNNLWDEEKKEIFEDIRSELGNALHAAQSMPNWFRKLEMKWVKK
jgi:hypothetical protein